jgi:hypothetical protein
MRLSPSKQELTRVHNEPSARPSPLMCYPGHGAESWQ